MSRAEARHGSPGAVASGAVELWQDLQAALHEIGTVPCQTADASAWWPDRRDLDSPATRSALAACGRCPVRHPCAAYALTADERFGIWGATTPDQRREAARAADAHNHPGPRSGRHVPPAGAGAARRP